MLNYSTAVFVAERVRSARSLFLVLKLRLTVRCRVAVAVLFA